MSSRTILGALAALLVAGLAIAVPSFAASGKPDPKTPASQSSSQQAAKAKADQAAAEKAAAEKAKAAKEHDKPCPPASSHGNGANGDHQDNGKHCGAEYPPQIGGHGQR
jgi:hypothetical protein